MKSVAFFSRFAFICNILFLVCTIIQYTTDFIGVQAITDIVVPLGVIVSPIINLIVCILYLVRLLRRRPLGIKPWLAITNAVFLIIQIVLIQTS